jgi:hypothetical protein
MKTECPHCARRIGLDNEALASLRGAAGFACPACGQWVPLAADIAAAAETVAAATQAGEDGSDWTAPAAEAVAAAFDSRFHIIRLLGRGGMGAVYEGFDTRLERRVAIKILPAETGANPAVLARFEREAKAMAALDHPNIVHIHDYGRTGDGHPYLVMEFIDGMDIHRLRQAGRLDLPGALDLVSQVCAALHYAHARGIIHRDIKPANIMVTTEGVAKVADFGLAKVLDSDDHPHADPALTRSGTAVGTLDYMAPEQLEGQPVDHRADIYSLGVMLYDLLTGTPPRGAWPPPSQRVRIDIRLDEIVLRALQQNPAARYQAAAEVRADVDSVNASSGGGPLPPGTDPQPLPSSLKPGPPPPAATLAPGGAPAHPPAAWAPADEAAASARSSANTLLVLGLLAIGITGGLALHLAKRTNTPTHTNQELVENIRVHRDIPPGLTAEDLDGVGDICSGPHGFIGASMQALDWDRAVELAQLTGADVLAVDEADPEWPALHEWLRRHFATPLAMQTWVRVQGTPGLLGQNHMSDPDSPNQPDPEPRRKVLLHWPAKAPVPSPPPMETPVPPAPPPAPGPIDDPAPADLVAPKK